MEELTFHSSKPKRRLRVLVAFLLVFFLLAGSVFVKFQLSAVSTIINGATPKTQIENDNRTYLSPATAAANIKQVVQLLTKSPMTRYYVYEDDRFKAIHRRRRFTPLRGRYQGFAEAEEHIIDTLANSRLRTRDPEEAELFFVPISLTRHIIERAPGSRSADVFNLLYNQTIFQANQGNRHFMIVQTPNLWSFGHLRMYSDKALFITQHYSHLWNVTIGKVFDQGGLEEANQKGLLEGNDFKSAMLDLAVPLSRSSFSLNFIPLPSFPFVQASMEKFRNSSWDFFYYSYNGTSVLNSTQYRHALLKETVWNALPGSSIGFDINPRQWMEHFQSSRFCLVIRGDNPASRSHLRAVKVGCISSCCV